MSPIVPHVLPQWVRKQLTMPARGDAFTTAVKAKGIRNRVEPKVPADVLGAYVYLPEGTA